MPCQFQTTFDTSSYLQLNSYLDVVGMQSLDNIVESSGNAVLRICNGFFLASYNHAYTPTVRGGEGLTDGTHLDFAAFRQLSISGFHLSFLQTPPFFRWRHERSIYMGRLKSHYQTSSCMSISRNHAMDLCKIEGTFSFSTIRGVCVYKCRARAPHRANLVSS